MRASFAPLLALAILGCHSSSSSSKRDQGADDLSVNDLSSKDLQTDDLATAPAQISVDHQPKFDFGNVVAGQTSATVTLTVTNRGGSDTGVIQSATVGAPFAIVTDSCDGQVLSAQQSCTVTVDVTPTSAGNLTGSFSIFSPGAGTATVELDAEAIASGTGPAALAFDQTAYAPASPVPVGSPTPLTLTLSNIGGATSGALPAIATTGDGQFSVSGGTCAAGQTLAASASCTIEVIFAPQHYGGVDGAISLSVTPGGTPSATLHAVGQQTFSLTINRSGNGSGAITYDLHDCSAVACESFYVVTDTPPSVQLTATPSPSSSLTSWSGDCTGNTSTCTVAMTKDRATTATFDLKKLTVTVNVVGVRGMTGTVASNQSPALVCSNNVCTAEYDYGTVVTLSATATAPALFQSWGASCANRFGATCATSALTSNFTTSATFRPRINYMFVTSDTVIAGAIGANLLSADQHCDLLARNAGLVNTPTTGTPYFKALLSTSTLNAKDRLTGAKGWIRPDGREFASSPIDLFNQAGATAPYQVFYPPSIDETGNAQVLLAAATGTTKDGLAALTCSDWSKTNSPDGVTLGAAQAGSDNWIARQNNSNCSGNDWHLYCFETAQPATTISPAPQATARVAFVSSGTITGMVGRSPATTAGTADALCAAEKGALPGTFLALLPGAALVDGGTNAASARFDLSKSLWVRPDNVILGATTADMMAWRWLAPLDETAAGTYATGFATVWVGAGAPDLDASDTGDCSDWSASGASGAYMLSANSLWDGYAWSNQPCSAQSRVFCVQQ